MKPAHRTTHIIIGIVIFALTATGGLIGWIRDYKTPNVDFLRITAQVAPTPISSSTETAYDLRNFLRNEFPELDVSISRSPTFDWAVEIVGAPDDRAAINSALDAFQAMVRRHVDSEFDQVRTDMASMPANASVYERFQVFRQYDWKQGADLHAPLVSTTEYEWEEPGGNALAWGLVLGLVAGIGAAALVRVTDLGNPERGGVWGD